MVPKVDISLTKQTINREFYGIYINEEGKATQYIPIMYDKLAKGEPLNVLGRDPNDEFEERIKFDFFLHHSVTVRKGEDGLKYSAEDHYRLKQVKRFSKDNPARIELILSRLPKHITTLLKEILGLK